MAGMNTVVASLIPMMQLTKMDCDLKISRYLRIMCNMSTEMFSTMQKFAGGVVTGRLKTFMTQVRN